MPTIRIDEEVWAALQKRATPLTDTPNDVLRRTFNLPPIAGSGGMSGKRPRPRVGATPQGGYRRPILEVLVEMGGRGQMNDVLDRVGEKMQRTLQPVDRQRNPQGIIRWRHNAMWERNTMRQEGLIKSGAPRGQWVITDKGRSAFQQTKSGKDGR